MATVYARARVVSVIGTVVSTSVASFLVLGGQDPQMYRQKKVTYMRERAKRASASETYFQVSKYICTYTMQFPFITYGIALYRQYNDKILTLSMRASGASELRKF